MRPEQKSTRLFLFLCLVHFAVNLPATAQTIYSENQLPARGVQIEYAVAINNPVSHLYDVAIEVRGLRGASVDFAMPAWEPGNYVIRDFARNVQDFRASTLR